MRLTWSILPIRRNPPKLISKEDKKLEYCYRLCIVLAVLSILINVSGWQVEVAAQNVDFPDPNLAAVVRSRLSLAEDAAIPQTSLAAITTLNGNDRGITDLTGLEHATGLTFLQLRENPIRDFTPIKSLTNLTSLNLIETGFSDSDISILEPLTNLQFTLYLERNRISDLQALVNVISDNMPNLTALGIGDNRFCDITPLTALADQLTLLNLNYSQISDFGPLAEFTNLTELYLKRTGIRDLRPLSGLTNLTQLSLSSNGISSVEPLRDLTNLTRLILDRNQITDLGPLSGLTNLTVVWACWNPFPLDPNPFASLSGLTNMEDFSVDTTYEALAMAVFPAAALQYFCDPANASRSGSPLYFCLPPLEAPPEPESEPESEPEPIVKQRRYITRCGLGWAPQSQFQPRRLEQPKVMIYALEFEYDPDRNAGYSCKAIEIRTGDDSIENLTGWKLYLGTLYNPSYRPLKIPEEHSQITDNILRLTPEMLGLETFPCSTANSLSHPLPSVHYMLKTDENVSVDTAYSCFIWGQNAWTTVNGVNLKSKRRVSSAALREMENPRLERYILDNTSVYITYMSLDEFTWDRAILSDWLLAPSASSAPGAPSATSRKLVTTWGALKEP